MKALAKAAPAKEGPELRGKDAEMEALVESKPQSKRFAFRHHVIDTDLPVVHYAKTVLADLDGDGRPEYVLGKRTGEVFWYKCHAPDRWTRHLLGSDAPDGVGACAIDVDGDGRIDYVTGGVWFRNTGDLDRPFDRIVFDPDLNLVHDVVAADIDGDGRLEVITMSDKHNLRWYRIPDEPARPWVRTDIGGAVHTGLAVGDVNGDGRLDIVRTDVWFENLEGDGSRWVEHSIAPNTPPPPDFSPAFTFDATHAVVCDVDRDGVSDIVFVDAEIPGGKVWWMENVEGRGLAWKRHDIFTPRPKQPRRGAFHSLYVGDLDGDGDVDVFSCKMEDVGGQNPPRYYIWENLDGVGGAWREHVILDANLGGHAAVVGDLTGNGRLDIVGKPWKAKPGNGLDGKMFVVFLENVSE